MPPATALAPWGPRALHYTLVFAGRIWVSSGQNRRDVWHSQDGVHWHEVPAPGAPRHAASIFLFDEALWVVAGNNMQSDVWKLVRAEARSGRN